MAGINNRVVGAVAIAAIAGFSLAACSKSNKAKTVTPNVTAPSQAAGGNGGVGSAGASAADGVVASIGRCWQQHPARQWSGVLDRYRRRHPGRRGNAAGQHHRRHQRRPARRNQLSQLHLDQGRVGNGRRGERLLRNICIGERGACHREGARRRHSGPTQQPGAELADR